MTPNLSILKLSTFIIFPSFCGLHIRMVGWVVWLRVSHVIVVKISAGAAAF